MWHRRSRLLKVAFALGAATLLVAASDTKTDPDVLPAHVLDQAFPRDYPLPLADQVWHVPGDQPGGVVGKYIAGQVHGDFGADPRAAGKRDWTASFWMKTTLKDYKPVVGANCDAGAYSTCRPVLVIAKGLAGGQAGLDLWLATDQSSTATSNKGNTAISDGAWHHVGITYTDAAKCFSVFVDDGLDIRRCGIASPAVTQLILNKDSAADLKFDDFRFYRRALSTGELGRLRSIADNGLLRVFPPIPFDSPALTTSGSGYTFTGKPAADIALGYLEKGNGLKALDLTPGKLQWTQDIAAVSELRNLRRGFTLAGWVSVSGAGTADNFLLVEEGFTAFQFGLANKRLTATVRGDGSFASDTITQSASDGTPALGSGFQFVALTYGEGKARLYRDGVMVAEKTAAHSAPTLRKLDGSAQSTFTMGGGTGVKIAWLALFDRPLTPTQLDNARSEGPSAWTYGPPYKSSGRAFPLDLMRELAPPVGAFTFVPPDPAIAGTNMVTLSNTGAAKAIRVNDSGAALSRTPFSLFARSTIGLPADPAATFSFISRRPAVAAVSETFSSQLECSTSSSTSSCRVRANSYVEPDDRGKACVTTSGANETATLSCPPGLVIRSITEAYASNATGSCDGGAFGGNDTVGGRQYADLVTFRCAGKTTCRVDDLAGTAPAGAAARLAVRATCVANVARNFCATSSVSFADDKRSTTLDCGAGKVWTRIDRVTFVDHTTPTCSPESYQLTDASGLEDLTSVAIESCLGKQTCTASLNGSRGYDQTAIAVGRCDPAPATEQPVCKAAQTGAFALACDAGLVIAEVKQAFYGNPGGTCPNLTQGSTDVPGVLAKVKARCVGLERCAVANPKSEFGTAATSASQSWLSVSVVCKPPPGPQQVCVNEANEGTTSLDCPSGYEVSSIDAVEYGNPTGGCTAGTPLVKGTCSAKTTREKVEERCLGKASCSFSAPVTEFKDPCPGTAKTFTVRATCKPTAATKPPVCVDTGNEPSELTCPPGEIIQNVEFAEFSDLTGSCLSAVSGQCASSGEDATQLAAVRGVCVGKSVCSLPAPLTFIPQSMRIEFWGSEMDWPLPCAQVAVADRRFVVRARCGRMTPRSWLSEPFAVGSASDERSVALSWDGSEPRFSIDGVSKSFTLDTQNSWLTKPLPPLTTGLKTVFGPERVEQGSTPKTVTMKVSELRMYGRALSTAELNALGSTCANMSCAEVGQQCIDRSTYSNARPITPQCTGCKPTHWSPTTAPDATVGDECLPDGTFMAVCAHDSQCTNKCDDGRCDAAIATEASATCESLGRTTLRNRCGDCFPDYTRSPDPDDLRCTWTPQKHTLEVCTSDAQCISGVCAKPLWRSFVPKGYDSASRGASPGDPFVCAPEACSECEAENSYCYQLAHTAHPSDYLTHKERPNGLSCYGCAPRFTQAYKLMSPEACTKAATWAWSTHYWSVPFDISYGTPTLDLLRKAILGEPKPWREVNAQDIADLEEAGVGAEYLGYAAMPSGSAKEAAAKRLSSAHPEYDPRYPYLLAGLGMCWRTGSVFDNPAQNPPYCRPEKLPGGATCPPPGQAITPPFTEHSFCKSGYCGPQGVCANQKARIEATSAENRADDTANQPADKKAMGDVAGAQQNTSTLDLGIDAQTTATRAECVALPARSEMRVRQGQQANFMGMGTADMFTVQINGKKTAGGKFETESKITVLGFPIGYDPDPLAGCTENAGQGKCSHKLEQWANLPAPAANICAPVPEVLEKAPYTLKKTFIAGPGIPILLSIGPILDVCVGLQVAREPEGMSAYVAVKGRVALGIDIRGGVGAEIGPIEIFAGIRAEVIVMAAGPTYKRTVGVTEISSKPALAAGQTGTPIGDKTFKISKTHKFELEIEVLSLAVSLLVEIKAWIFGFEIERKLAEIAGLKKIVADPESEPETNYLVPCFGKKD